MVDNSAFIYIIIPNTNGHFHTIECLESVLKLDYTNFKVIVIDNSDNDTSYHYILDWCNGRQQNIKTNFVDYVYPLVAKPLKHTLLFEKNLPDVNCKDTTEKLIIIKANSNEGFSAANNVAIKYILRRDDFDWLWLLNNDTVIPPNCLQMFVNHDKDHHVGVFGTKLYYYYSPKNLQGIGGRYNKWFSTTKHIAENEVDKGQYDEVAWNTIADYVIGASMFVSIQFLKDVGLMCEDYFFYFEELDWILRGKNKGWKVGFLPACKVYHKDGGTVPNQNKIKSVLSDIASVRNRLFFSRKFYPLYSPIAYSGLLAVIALRIKRKQYKRLINILIAVLFNKSPKEYIGFKD